MSSESVASGGYLPGCIAPGVETTSECPKDTPDLMRGHRAKY